MMGISVISVSMYRGEKMLKQNNVIAKSFGWMFIGLLLTFATGYYLSCNEYTLYKIFSGGLWIVLILLELGTVIFLSSRINKMSPNTAKIVFMLYSVLTGLTFSSIFILYELQSIIYVFIATGLVFGIFALLGYYTKIDLTKFGTYLMMMLFGIIICSIINIFIGSTMFDTIISCISIIVFVAYTAYDVKKIKMLAESSTSENIAIIGALELYLDFINLFLEILNLFGKSKD